MKLMGVFFILFFPMMVFCQSEEDMEFMKDTAENIPTINEYDKFNPVLGGDAIRKCNNVPCNDLVKDLYPNGNVKHRALYVNGKIQNQSKNFFENGQVEREFKATDAKKSSHEILYPNGKVRSRVDYIHKQALKWEDFFSNGNPEFYEEFDKSFDFHVAIKYFYFNGKPQSEMVLIDKKKRIYDYKEYFPNGQIKTEGQKIHNAAMNDYQKFGNWKSYDRNNKVTAEESFVKGNVTGSGDPILDFDD